MVTLRVSLPTYLRLRISHLLEDNYADGTIGAIEKELKGQLDKDQGRIEVRVNRMAAWSAIRLGNAETTEE